MDETVFVEKMVVKVFNFSIHLSGNNETGPFRFDITGFFFFSAYER